VAIGADDETYFDLGRGLLVEFGLGVVSSCGGSLASQLVRVVCGTSANCA